MKIKWERNSRALSLVVQGKINDEDIIPRTTTDKFPAEMATVRMQRLNEKVPHLTLHIRGKLRQNKLWNGHAYEYAKTCRVGIVGSNAGIAQGSMYSNGELDENLSWLDVHNAVIKARKTMGI